MFTNELEDEGLAGGVEEGECVPVNVDVPVVLVHVRVFRLRYRVQGVLLCDIPCLQVVLRVKRTLLDDLVPRVLGFSGLELLEAVTLLALGFVLLALKGGLPLDELSQEELDVLVRCQVLIQWH